ncbi:2-C-methyl-D-erythritol 4-phosphate cytidylyltransferase [Aeromicrobium sp.]|uniref:2-C-methyl-D-erythritol 4-phosphate cytidylyltransferase n=1 Tax=Aeromicrobium sp. TaxID=1871063 RepID=UPI003C55DB26
MTSSPQTVLVLGDRGTLPFEELHGEPLYFHALRALVEAFPVEATITVDDDHLTRVRTEVEGVGIGARVVTGGEWWDGLAGRRAPDLLVHDVLCPLTTAQFLRRVWDRATARPGCSFMSYRPVTDTTKTVVDGRISGTIDRQGLAALVSPAVVPASSLDAAIAADRRPPLSDFAELAAWLRSWGDLELVKAPSMARRVDDASAVNLLQCLDEVGRRVHVEPGSV